MPRALFVSVRGFFAALPNQKMVFSAYFWAM